MQIETAIEIRSLGVTKVNRIVRAARQIDVLRPAFDAWQRGEIYVCAKTQAYRFRFGDRSKSITPWSAVVHELFADPAEFAFAAMVLGPTLTRSRRKVVVEKQQQPKTKRVNVIAMVGGCR